MNQIERSIAVGRPHIRGREIRTTRAGDCVGDFVNVHGNSYYRIRNYNAMPPFFMSITSSSDHWLFISSNGGITAGRRDASNALFPYYTEDKITESCRNTGSTTIIHVKTSRGSELWEPFTDNDSGLYRKERDLYKSAQGDSIIFEELNLDLCLGFRCTWSTSPKFGFVRRAELINLGDNPVSVELLDGIRNLLPYGIEQTTQNEVSCLLDAYKRGELESGTGLGIFSLSSILTDRAEPSEALKATTVFTTGLDREGVLLSERQLSDFRHGHRIEHEAEIFGERSAYLTHAVLTLDTGEQHRWLMVAELEQDRADVAKLLLQLQSPGKLSAAVMEDVEDGSRRLEEIIAAADGLQSTADQLTTTHHLANVMFNVMRGGVFANGYAVERDDLLEYLRNSNQQQAEQHAQFLDTLPEHMTLPELQDATTSYGDSQLERLCYEYLPICFSRRHGDPSRPWNRFSINLKDQSGKELLDYQGNWRDIFQNWEALCLSYPYAFESIVAKFVNASTADGYNPYRITRDGIDWEVPEPENPWSNIGYWGDHQIVYLEKLQEWSTRFRPEALQRLLSREIFAYANVPYRIKPYESIVENPRTTIDFDTELDAEIGRRVEATGSDGKLVRNADGQVYLVNLVEKMLLAALTKLSNYVPGGGIWMNTQRPEWNDANNALVGNGLSMVTLFYVRRYLSNLESMLEHSSMDSYSMSVEIADLFNEISSVFAWYTGSDAAATPDRRRAMMDWLGTIGSGYRQRVYRGFSGKKRAVDVACLRDFLTNVHQHIHQTIDANRRPDGLYHSYNLLQLAEGRADVSHLYEMLEGQVAALSSGALSPTEALRVLQALRESRMYREDQHSYMLYPNRRLPGFLERNNIPFEHLSSSKVLVAMAESDDTRLISRDVNGDCHFNGTLRNAQDLQVAMADIPITAADKRCIQEIFETVFDHKSFTGRSGTFYAYEGLGSIYWHMVSKLLLAVQENYFWSLEAGADKDLLAKLASAYYDIREGIGFNKTPENYGAFPTDPYSHTPTHTGARQPGMTGQVKEEVITRLGELGVIIENGAIRFQPGLLRLEEFRREESSFNYIDVARRRQSLRISPGSLAFTYCQTPIVYRFAEEARVRITRHDGQETVFPGLRLGHEVSDSIFRRTGEIAQITAYVPEDEILPVSKDTQ